MVAVQVTSATPATAWQVSAAVPDPANPAAPSVLDAFEMMQAVAPAGYITELRCYQQNVVNETGVTGGDIALDLKLTRPGYPDQPAPVGDWVIFDGTNAIVVDPTTYQQNYTPMQGGS